MNGLRRFALVLLLLLMAACGSSSAARVNVVPNSRGQPKNTPAPRIATPQPIPTSAPTTTPTSVPNSPARIRFAAGATTAIAADVVAAGETQHYILHGTAYQTNSISVVSPDGSARLALASVAAANQPILLVENVPQWVGQWTVDGDYLISISSTSDAPTPYELTISTIAIAPLPTPTITPTPTAIPPTATPVPPPVADKVVYLTFDDGPDPKNTPAILATLARYNAQATFFVVGRSAQAFPDLVQAEAAAGHAIGNHTFTHATLNGIGHDGFMREVLATRDLLGGAGVPCLRPPYGAQDAYTQSYAAEAGYSLVMWTLDSGDWKQPGTDIITARVLNNVRDGSIILMHDGGGDRAQTSAALDIILADLTSRGYRFAALCK